MNHKRHKPKSRRAGCLFCKPWKHQRAKGTRSAMTMQDRRAGEALRQEIDGRAESIRSACRRFGLEIRL